MSYDLVLVTRREGEPWETALERSEAEQDAPLSESQRAQFSQIERRVRARVGAVETFVDEKVAELSHSSGLQVSLFAREAAVSYPYWERDDREAFHALVRDVVRIVEEETHLEAWDPQTGQAFDGRFDDEGGRAAVREMNRAEQEAPARRSRALRYLLVGGVITPLALALLLVEVRPLVLLGLIIGLADLAIGAYLWRRRR